MKKNKKRLKHHRQQEQVKRNEGLDKSDSQRRQVLVTNSVICYFILFIFSGPELTP
jgi:hypothetical protein